MIRTNAASAHPVVSPLARLLAASMLAGIAGGLVGCGSTTTALGDDAPARRQVAVAPPSDEARAPGLGVAMVALGAGDASGQMVHEYWLAHRDDATDGTTPAGTTLVEAALPVETR